ncbi:MAG: branched-chain amino acid transport system II carrier protein, partial [Lachnospiraceae bacterium]|nr:branched-chain amino acid transport system II carrier protein [Lachnospiraceae bacterium]
MKKKLSIKETIFLSSMLFGLFFGAGNIIFPVYMGQMAGKNVWIAIIGFLVTGVGLPLLGVAAIGISKSTGLFDLSSNSVGKKYGKIFTTLLYLTIGPFFAIPRCATVPFTTGIEPMLHGKNTFLPLAIFSLIFFLIVLWFSLKPGKILVYVGKVLNPLFLICLAVLILTALFNPMGNISQITPDVTYKTGTFFRGFLEGYNTMDALAGLAFGIVVVNVIKGLGIEDPVDIAKSTVKAGIGSSIIMAVIYGSITIVGVQSRGLFATSSNGGEALTGIAHHYFGSFGSIMLSVIITLACLKTSIGLITSCSETFEELYPSIPRYKTLAIIFCIVSFLIANLGLSSIISYSIPVLMFLYPLAITLMVLALLGKLFANDKRVYISVTIFTLFAAFIDFLRNLPEGTQSIIHDKG